jgi:hypothetical protein
MICVYMNFLPSANNLGISWQQTEQIKKKNWTFENVVTKEIFRNWSSWDLCLFWHRIFCLDIETEFSAQSLAFFACVLSPDIGQMHN